MSRKESEVSDDSEGGPSKTLWLTGEPLPLGDPRQDISRLLLAGVLLVVGAVLLSCSGSAANANSVAKASPASNQTPSPTPNSVAGKSSPSVAPTVAAKAGPKLERIAEPKKIIPAPTVVAAGKGPRIAFVNQEVDFGNVQFGDVVQYAFEFKNVGNEPLIISKAQVDVVEGC